MEQEKKQQTKNQQTKIQQTEIQCKAYANADRFFVDQLTQTQKENFFALYSTAQAVKPCCHLPHPVSCEEAERYIAIMTYECPELFHVITDGYAFENEDTTDKFVQNICITYSMNAHEYAVKLSECEAQLEKYRRLIAGLSAVRTGSSSGCHTLSSEYNKELLAYDFITGLCAYDLEAADCANAYGALVTGRAKCIGISLAFKWLLETAGMQCLVLSGYGPEGMNAAGHVWNVVRVDGRYLDVDASAESPRGRFFRTSQGQSESTGEPSLCLSPRLYPAFNVDCHWIRDLWDNEMPAQFSAPGTGSMEYSYHAVHGSLVESDDEIQPGLFAAFDQALDKALNKGSEGVKSAAVQFATDELYRTGRNRMKEIYMKWMEEKMMCEDTNQKDTNQKDKNQKDTNQKDTNQNKNLNQKNNPHRKADISFECADVYRTIGFQISVLPA